MLKQNCESNSGRGYTLVEILVSAAILTISISAISALIAKGRELDSKSKEYIEARIIATRYLENPVYQSSNYPSVPSSPIPISEVIDGINYSGTVAVRTSSSTIAHKTITVTINADGKQLVKARKWITQFQ